MHDMEGSTEGFWSRARSLVAIAFACVLLAPIGPVFFPTREAPFRADVILVLGPASDSRLLFAERLIDAGYSDTLLISAAVSGPGRTPLIEQFCAKTRPFTVHCQQAEPFTTQGEIGWLERSASGQGWNTALVVTETTHVQRTRLYADRCFSGHARVLSDETPLSSLELPYEYAYETAGFLKAALVSRGCA
ncbi:hypothetical protein [Pseudoclavibacter sp. RFBA6]|uniref:hypothetical protein n=1 Tax=Pseudoclavibacter sp. RFBA6 TaxID=2080573 RepID=UPI000CE7CB4C|nr:hypothetical protein [Pseudoclavibacter sp. RFBA6]PPG43397.1 hypothetical protein C5C17_02270 [Pseudoclavibacter sp. RFBA6]